MRGFSGQRGGKRMSGILKGIGEWDGEMPDYSSDIDYSSSYPDSGGYDQSGMPEYISPVLTATPGGSIYPPYRGGDLPTVFDAPGSSTYNPIVYDKPPNNEANINPADIGKLITYGGQLFRIAQQTTQQGQKKLIAQPLGGQPSPMMIAGGVLLAILLLK